MNTETLALKIEEQIYQKAVAAISGWNESDIYVASFYSWQDEDDPCKPRLTIGYNTERQYESALEEADGDANDARWNYAWFLQDEDAFCEHGGDAETEELIRQWVASQGIDEEDWEACEPLEGASATGNEPPISRRSESVRSSTFNADETPPLPKAGDFQSSVIRRFRLETPAQRPRFPRRRIPLDFADAKAKAVKATVGKITVERSPNVNVCKG